MDCFDLEEDEQGLSFTVGGDENGELLDTVFEEVQQLTIGDSKIVSTTINYV